MDTVLLTLKDLAALADTAARNGTTQNFPAVALQWAAGAQAEIDRLRAEVAALREDAERYLAWRRLQGVDECDYGHFDEVMDECLRGKAPNG